MKRIIFACVLAIMPLVGFAGAQTTPQSVVAALYKQHDAEKGPFIVRNSRPLVDKYFTRQLADLLWKEFTSTSGEVGAIDFDPLYNTQDTVDVKNFSIKRGVVKGSTGTVTVGFVDADRKQVITFSMKRERGKWRIADIGYPDSDGILKMLKDTYSKPAG